VRRCVVLLALVACKHEPKQVQPAVGEAGPQGCEQVPFAPTAPVPEASGGAWIDFDGKPALLVISDSGNDGAYTILDAESGASLEQGKMPLGHGSDDIEGLASRDGKIYGLTSAGFMRVWERDADGKSYKLVDGPYPISDKRGFVCDINDGNCAKNYEGLAIAPKADGPCAGFAASKEDGTLYCLVELAGTMHLDPTIKIKVDRKNVVADAAFSPEGQLYVGNNMFGLATVYRIDNWKDPANAKVVEIGELGVGFPEVVAARGDSMYRLSDTGGSPSMMVKFRCEPSPR
jgi:hypothetical protein